MHLNWRQRLTQMPHLRDLANWPVIDMNTLPADKRSTFTRNRAIVAQVLNGHVCSAVARDFNLTPSMVCFLLNRSLAGPEEETPPCLYALIPYVQVTTPQRRQPLPEWGDKRGAKSAFSRLLKEAPSVKKGMDRMIKKAVRRSPYGQNISASALHGEFKRLLADINWDPKRYPYTEASVARESVRQYGLRQAKVVAMPQPLSRVIQTLSKNGVAGLEIEIDEHLCDGWCRVDVPMQGRLKPARLSRISLILVKERTTSCYLGYAICLTRAPSQFDMLRLLSQLYTPWQPMDLKSPGLAYAPEACFPSALGDEFCRLGFSLIRLDNALMHTAHSIQDFVCHQLHATLNTGLPGCPKHRAYIESAFRKLNLDVHRSASTAGTGPADPRRESRTNAKKPPVITLRTFEEIVNVLLTNHNVQPMADLGMHTPLQQLCHIVKNYPVRLLPPAHTLANQAFLSQQRVPVKCNIDNRPPFVYFMYARYKGNCLHSEALMGKSVWIEIDARNVRTLRVYSEKHELLGEVRAEGRWDFDHALSLRKKLHAWQRDHRHGGPDILAAFYHHLLENADLPTNVTELMWLARHVGDACPDISDKKTKPRRKKADAAQSRAQPATNAADRWYETR